MRINNVTLQAPEKSRLRGFSLDEYKKIKIEVTYIIVSSKKDYTRTY
jgi:hypothetical protein